MPTNNLAPKTKNYLSPIPPNMAERFGSAVLPYFQGVQGLFPPTNPYGQALSNFLLGQAPQAAQRMAEGYPNVLFDTRNPLGANRLVNPVALDMAAALPVATALKGAGLAKGGVAATFAGARAKTANHTALALAEKMKAAGVADEEIHKATGWFFGSADGKPRFEIPDDESFIREANIVKNPTQIEIANQYLWDNGIPKNRGVGSDPSLVPKQLQQEAFEYAKMMANQTSPKSIPINEAISHQKLFETYPELVDTKFVHEPGNNIQGSFNNQTNTITAGGGNMINTADNTRSTTLHELQHAIQQREGFARGGSPEMFSRGPMFNVKARNLEADLSRHLSGGVSAHPDEIIGSLKYGDANELNSIAQKHGFSGIDEAISFLKAEDIKRTPFGQYQRLAGEAEARLTQSRMTMTGAERAASYPPGMYDVPVSDQIVRYGEGPALATTWHGSPHKFEPTPLNDLGEFNAAKIGSGEGAQAYGHGHYTAENPSIAKSYQEELSRPQATLDFVDRQGNPANMEHFNDHPELASEIDNAMEAFDADGTVSPDFDEVLNNVRFNLTSEINNRYTDPADLPALKNSLAKLDAVEGKYNFVRNENAGSLYKVDIPDEHIAQMLDWDKPLSEQSESVRANLANTKNKQLRAVIDYANSPYSTPGLEGEVKTMGEAIKLLGMNASPAKGSAMLAKQGIPGIRYLDAGSRGAEGGTSNFVVFPGNEHMMTILERNGQAMSPESQAIARYREIKGPKSVVRMEAALRTAGVPLPKNEPVAYIQRLVDQAHRRN